MQLALLADRIDVWPFRTDKTGFAIRRLESVLSEDELARADHFRTDHLRRSFVLSRGMLRMLCSCYLDCHPAALEFEYGCKGKPLLVGGCSLGFNVSHSGDLIAFAFARQLELGIDIEEVRHIEDIEAIAQRFFCAEEASEVLRHSGEERASMFYKCWTRKEAFIKATGNGLSTPLDSFRVSLDGRGAHARLVHINFDEREAAEWNLHALELSSPYVGALCYKGATRDVQVATF